MIAARSAEMKSRHLVALFAFAALPSAGLACSSSSSGGTAQTGPTGGSATAGSGRGTAGTGAGGTTAAGGTAAGGATAGAGGVAAGAGGAAGGTGGGVGTGAGGGAGPALTGSFDLKLPSVKQSKMPLGAKSPTPTTNLRLDLRASGPGFEAMITPSFGEQAPMTVALSPTSVTLTGMVKVAGNDPSSGNVTDTWTSFVFQRAADGSLADAVHAVGDEEAFGGDVVDSATLTGDGAIALDTTKPLVKLATVGTGGPKGFLLPWDDFAVRVSEGVVPEALVKALSVSLAGNKLAIAKTAAPTTWPGAIHAKVLLVGWDVDNGMLDVATEGSIVTDPSNNAAAPFVGTVSVKAVASAQPSHSFDGDVVFVTPWGLTTFLGSKAGADPNCEMGGCAQLGPLDVGYCAKDEAGLAGRITIDGKTALAVRYRVFSSAQGTTLAPLAITVTSHDGLTTTAAAVPKLAPSMGDLAYASDWMTEVVPLPAGATGEVGFVLRAGTNEACGFVPPPAKARIVIDRVEAQ